MYRALRFWLPCVAIVVVKALDDVAGIPLNLADTLDASHWITYAFKPDSSTATLVNNGNQLFNSTKIYSDGQVEVLTKSFMTQTLKTSTSSSEASDTFSESVGVDASYGAFAGAVSASTTKTSESNFKQIRSDQMTRAQQKKVLFTAAKPQDYLRDDVKEQLLSATPERITDLYGPFYAWEISLGGVISTTMVQSIRSEEDEVAFKAEVEASWEVLAASAAASASASTSSTSKSSQEDIYVKTHCEGGETTIWLNNDMDFGTTSTEWAASIDDSNLAPIGYSLLYVWDLVKSLDAEKGAALEEYQTALWKNQLEEILLAENAKGFAPQCVTGVYTIGADWNCDNEESSVTLKFVDGSGVFVQSCEPTTSSGPHDISWTRNSITATKQDQHQSCFYNVATATCCVVEPENSHWGSVTTNADHDCDDGLGKSFWKHHYEFTILGCTYTAHDYDYHFHFVYNAHDITAIREDGSCFDAISAHCLLGPADLLGPHDYETESIMV